MAACAERLTGVDHDLLQRLVAATLGSLPRRPHV